MTTLAEFISEHADEFAPFDLGDTNEIAETLKNSTVIGNQHEGFAVVHPGEAGASLWLLYVPKHLRRRGRGLRLLRAAERVDADHYLSLVCHKNLRRWYGNKGYRVEGKSGDKREMIGPFETAAQWAEYRAHT